MYTIISMFIYYDVVRTATEGETRKFVKVDDPLFDIKAHGREEKIMVPQDHEAKKTKYYPTWSLQNIGNMIRDMTDINFRHNSYGSGDKLAYNKETIRSKSMEGSLSNQSYSVGNGGWATTWLGGNTAGDVSGGKPGGMTWISGGTIGAAGSMSGHAGRVKNTGGNVGAEDGAGEAADGGNPGAARFGTDVGGYISASGNFLFSQSK